MIEIDQESCRNLETALSREQLWASEWLDMSQPSTHLHYSPYESHGNDVGTVMKYSGHKTLESFSNYIHPTEEGRTVSMQALDNVDGILTAQGSVESVRSNESVKKRSRKTLHNKQVAV